ncbi:MAG: AEC family transporter [Gammaproteobacteria bacterium]|nr:MAG: AEC family transporter [Gammaproteobacteria bacterium]
MLISALLPVFVLILVGLVLKRTGFPSDAFWPGAEKLMYYVLFPALLILKLTYAKTDGLDLPQIALVLLTAFGAGTLLLIGLQQLFRWSGAVFTSVYQGGIRFNSYVVLAAVAALYGDQGIAVAAVIMSLMIPLINVLCILIFARYGSGSVNGLRGTLKAIATNPLILSCVAGLALNLTGIRFPQALFDSLSFLSAMALPLGLLCVGAGMDLKALRETGVPLVISSAFKLAVFPWVLAGTAALFGLPSLTVKVFALIGAMPTATASYILARQLGGHAGLMAGLISAQTLLAMGTLPLLLGVLHRTLL